MPKDTKTLGNSKARACESLGFVHKKGCARVLTQPLFYQQEFSSSGEAYCVTSQINVLPYWNSVMDWISVIANFI